MRSLLRSVASDPAEPDWSAFWSGVQARIAREKPKPVKDAWWLPLWRPFWGHPRLALGGGVLAAALALVLAFGPSDDGWAGSVVVQDVSTPDPNKSVMVYSNPEQAVTVIWLFNSDGSTEES